MLHTPRKKSVQISWNKVPLEKEIEVITDYNNGLSIQRVALKTGFSRDTVWRILKRNNVKSRPFGTYKRTNEHKDISRKTLINISNAFSEEERKQISKLGGKKRGEQLKLDIEHQKKVGKLGGLKTKEIQKLHPEILIPFIEAGKLNNAKLIRWQQNNQELMHKISSDTAKRTHQKDSHLAHRMGKSTQVKHPNQSREVILKTLQKYPDLPQRNGLLVSKIHPHLAKERGKLCQLKHPHQSSETLKKTHREMRERNPEKYSERQTKAMIAGSKGKTKPEKVMESLLPSDFVYNQSFLCGAPDFRSESRKIIIQVDGPTHYKTMGKFYGESRLIKRQQTDKRQDKRWVEEGYQIFHFTDFEINKEKEGVIEKLKQILN